MLVRTKEPHAVGGNQLSCFQSQQEPDDFITLLSYFQENTYLPDLVEEFSTPRNADCRQYIMLKESARSWSC